MPEGQTEIKFAVYLLQAETDDDWVEQHLALRLMEEEQTKPFFLKWQRIPGDSRQQTMVNGFNRSKCCAVCIGGQGLGGLTEMMQQVATDRRAQSLSGESPYRLIPVILPGGDPNSTPELLKGAWSVDFRNEENFDWEFHRLVCAIQGIGPGPRPLVLKANQNLADVSVKARQKLADDFVNLLDVIEAGEKRGLPKKEAEAFRDAAFREIMKQVMSSSPDKVNVQESRTTDRT